MKKVMISQPMGGKTSEEILATKERATKVLEAMGYEVVNSLFSDEWGNNSNLEAQGVTQIPLYFLAKSLEVMSQCHAVYFCKEWYNARGCRIEHETAIMYGLEVMYEDHV